MTCSAHSITADPAIPSNAIPAASIPPNSALRGAVCVFLLAVFALLVARFDLVVDDAFISFRYSRNLAEGTGLRYNVADRPVEGYSCFLWVLALTPFEWLQLDVPIASRFLTIASALLLLWRIAARLGRLGVAWWPAAIATASAAWLPSFAVWSTTGMETMPFCLLFFLAYEALLADSAPPRVITTFLVLLALSLMRTEGILWAGLFLGLAILDALPYADAARRVARLLLILLLLAVAYAAYSYWRINYFGHWLSNPSRVKLHWSTRQISIGLAYVWQQVHWTPGLPLVVLAGLLCLRTSARVVLPLLVLLLAVVAYAVAVGGDFMFMGRFLLPAIPFCGLLLGIALQRVWRRRAARGVLASFAIVIVLFHILPAARIHPFGGLESPYKAPWQSGEASRMPLLDQYRGFARSMKYWSRVGLALRKYAEPGDRVTLGAIGAIGYYSRLHVYDWFGLVAPEVASFPFDADAPPGHQVSVPFTYFDDRKPEIFDVSIWSARRWPPRPMPRTLTDGVYFNPKLRVNERMSRRLYPLDVAEGFRAGTVALITRRTGLTVESPGGLVSVQRKHLETGTGAKEPLPPP